MLPARKIELSPRLKLSVGRGLSQTKKLKIFASSLLVISLALTVNAVRLIFSNSGNDSAALEKQVLGVSNTRPQQQNEIQFIEYTVQKSDTLFSISQKFNINWTTLATLNNLKSPFLVKPGQTIKVPQ
ncbi:MAG: LysM peptidoglycan-binding domain-containing protein [Candidatus Doudnabacteria bacterium]|nr:LysM peptidoglycan-binding domain-containing protein [Candidatus Doudnabacteria bacterium]